MAEKRTGTSTNLFIDEDIDDSLLDSPVKPTQKPKEEASKVAHSFKPAYANNESRDAALRQELANVRKVNETIEGVIESLDKAKTNMTTVNQTVGAASSLLNMWTRILSQTEHNQRLILDPTWQGASQDMADMETEAVARRQAAARKEAEEQERRSNAAKKAEEDERRRATETTKQQKTSLRVRGRVTTRGASASQSGNVGDTSTASTRGVSSNRRTTSGVGRGRGGRGRG